MSPRPPCRLKLAEQLLPDLPDSALPAPRGGGQCGGHCGEQGGDAPADEPRRAVALGMARRGVPVGP